MRYVAVPVKVHLPGLPDITRIAMGYCGINVIISANGHLYYIPKSKLTASDHARLNEALRKAR
jgi:hypothetical protein